MFKAKFLITLAAIAAIHQFYGDGNEDLTKVSAPTATCAVSPAMAQGANRTDSAAFDTQSRSCAESETRLTASNG